MKTNRITIAFLSLACITLFGNCKKEDDTSGEMKAAVSAACSTTINYDGTHVFAYQSDIPGTLGEFLVGGYPEGEGRELGFYMAWPPATGTFDLTVYPSRAYYDPNNTCDDCEEDGVDQYGSISGQVIVTDVQVNGTEVTLVDLTFSNVMVVHYDSLGIPLDTLCLNAGIIKYN